MCNSAKAFEGGVKMVAGKNRLIKEQRTEIEQLRNRNQRLRTLLQQWVSGVDRGAAIPKNQLMNLLKEELATSAAEECEAPKKTKREQQSQPARRLILGVMDQVDADPADDTEIL